MPRVHPERCTPDCRLREAACPTRAIEWILPAEPAHGPGLRPLHRLPAVRRGMSDRRAGAQRRLGLRRPRAQRPALEDAATALPAAHALRATIEADLPRAACTSDTSTPVRATPASPNSRRSNNPFYNLHRLGIFFTASPRSADLLLVTGPVTHAMRTPLRATWEAMPEPRLVMAAGNMRGVRGCGRRRLCLRTRPRRRGPGGPVAAGMPAEPGRHHRWPARTAGRREQNVKGGRTRE